MTIAISLKVNDGLVLAADSASTMVALDASGNPTAMNVYNNANKIFNLRKGLPIGAITWGMGSIGQVSISTLAKDLRIRFTETVPGYEDWRLDPQAYRVADVAARVRQFMYEEHYQQLAQPPTALSALGFIVAGYSAGEPMAEDYQIDIDRNGCQTPSPCFTNHEPGLVWRGEPEAISRLILGHGTGLADVLKTNLGVPDAQIAPTVAVMEQALTVNLMHPAMPIQDAIDLAEFLVDTAVRWARFRPGATTVGGPIEIAAISKHEHFKWVRRKHYYTSELNPEGA